MLNKERLIKYFKDENSHDVTPKNIFDELKLKSSDLPSLEFLLEELVREKIILKGQVMNGTYDYDWNYQREDEEILAEGVPEEIRRFVDEVIMGDDKNLNKLKSLLSGFFKNKDQKDFDKINKEVLQQLVQLNDILSKNKELTTINRALLDRVFHYSNPLKFVWYERTFKLFPKKLKAFRDYLIKNIDFHKKEEDGFKKWIDWVIADEIEWDDDTFDSINNDFRVKLNFTNYRPDRPDVDVFMIGDKKYKETMVEALIIME